MAEVERRITRVLSNARYRQTGISVMVRSTGQSAAIMVGDITILVVTREDAAGTTVTPLELAHQWGRRLQAGLNRAIPRGSPTF